MKIVILRSAVRDLPEDISFTHGGEYLKPRIERITQVEDWPWVSADRASCFHSFNSFDSWLSSKLTAGEILI